MLFVPTVKAGKELQEGLKSVGVNVPFYHSRLGTANERDMLLGQFTGRIEPAVRVIICTNAFGMGLDVPDVRLVVHWQHPASVEDHLQEYGRAGRDGKPSVAVLFVGKNDEGLLKFMAGKTAELAGDDVESRERSLEAKLEAIADMRRIATSRDQCVRDDVASYFGATRSRRRRSVAVRIVEWLLTRRVRVERQGQSCCDWCDQVNGSDFDEVLAWAAGAFVREGATRVH